MRYEEMSKATIVLFSGDLDKALAAFVIASGAAASGWDVTVFFTFWGINVVRDDNKKALNKKEFVEKMFGSMMPNGADKLKLSKMNMGGMGTSMMKKRMKVKNVKSLREMIKDAKELDVKFLVCDMSMDIMGLKKEEFIDEVDEIVGVGTYLKESKDANLTLFI
ncbi:MAG: DsrE/DsrF/DrsH-like family protein [Thermoplasmata archaeon]|nr:MAG: DsrE/DsrF/DrsH-like family protein [Thermoplasmata archaeon]